MEYSKRLFASLINAKKDEVAISYSVSTALLTVLSAMNFTERDELLVSDLEWPTTNYIFHAFKKLGARVRMIKSQNYRITLDQYEKNITDKTRLVAAVHVASINGFRQDVKEIVKIAHRSGALVYVDDFQSLGTIPMDVKKYDIDILISGTYKWLLGIPGVAYLYVKEELIQELEPIFIGWFSQKDPFRFGADRLEYADNADRFQLGTWSVLGVYAAIEGMELIKEIGPENIESHIESITQHAFDYGSANGLISISPESPKERGAIISFLVRNPHEIEMKLKKRGIVTSARDVGLRLAPHFFNNKEDVETAIDQLISILRETR